MGNDWLAVHVIKMLQQQNQQMELKKKKNLEKKCASKVQVMFAA